MKISRRTAVLAVALLTAASLAFPARGQEEMDPVEWAFEKMFPLASGLDYGYMQVDGQFYNPFGGFETGIEAPELDLTHAGVIVVQPDPSASADDYTTVFGPDSPIGCGRTGDLTVLCSPNDDGTGDAYMNGFALIGARIEGPLTDLLEGRQTEFAAIFNVPSLGDPFVPAFEFDAFQMANWVLVVRSIDGEFSYVGLQLVDQSGGFTPFEPNGRAIVDFEHGLVVFLEPGFPDADGYRVYSFTTLLSAPFTMDTVVGNSWPFVTDPLSPVTQAQTITFASMLPEPTTTTVTTTTTTTTTTATTTTATTTAAAETSSTTAPPQAAPADGVSWRNVIFVAALLVGGLASLYVMYSGLFRTRTRKKKKDDDDGDDPRDTPPPAIYGESLEERRCEWALYYYDGNKTVPLREPAGLGVDICCKYTVSVQTKVNHEQAIKARQDQGDERLRIPDLDFRWAYIDFDAHVSTRSGPAGRLDWMQGLGDPTEQEELASDGGFWQQGQGEEPPELASHLFHAEVSIITIEFEPGCDDYRNLYTMSGRTQGSVLATQECTNDAGDPCPVELNAFGVLWGRVSGPGALFAQVSEIVGADIDELEQFGDIDDLAAGRGPTPEPLEPATLPAGDGHDHVERDRSTYTWQSSDQSSDIVEADSIDISVYNVCSFDSGQIVPLAVQPTTERVTAHIEGELIQNVDVKVELTPIECDCHGSCLCDAEWSMSVSGAAAVIDFGTGKAPIWRDPFIADRNNPFTGSRYWPLAGAVPPPPPRRGAGGELLP